MTSSLKQVNKDLYIQVKVKTSQSVNQIKVEGEQIVISVKTPPLKGKANRTIVKMVKKLFQREAAIISGIKSTDKILLVKNVSIDQAKELLKRNTKK